ncbi:ParA family protein [Halobacteria archaeon AArc-m2/3/4]|uniref:ParA family protein n=1 Tax=Natronoglomus mannanivorans TaxID=2979990 RepID=A0AAP2Z4G0_9EURY|nr:ParA family protein [Halovivax sp. KZCA124]MCU4744690.1 ParA family protein [Halobacteria archaeon AArc-xg1-1]MCU4975063.1 ParA family protein [Halobacteria archaeon AArc-m2/3/4]
MIPYTVWSEAGGVGKTTFAVNLARAHARQGQRVLAIDMDPQDGGLTHHFGVDENKADSESDNLVLHMIERGYGPFEDIIEPAEEGVDVIPSHNMLERLEEMLTKNAELEEGTNPDSDYVYPKEKQLRRVLVDSGVINEYDTLIVDPPATTGQHLYNSVYSTSNLLIPFEPSPKGGKSIDGLRDVVNGLEDTLEDIEVGVLGAVPNRTKGTNINEKYVAKLEEEELPIAPISIGERGSMLGDAWDNQVSIFELAENDAYRSLRDYEEPTLDQFDQLAEHITKQFEPTEVKA